MAEFKRLKKEQAQFHRKFETDYLLACQLALDKEKKAREEKKRIERERAQKLISEN